MTLPTGVGTQARKLLIGLQRTGLYQISQMGGSMLPTPSVAKAIDGIKLYPLSNGYGDADTFRQIFYKEKPDIVIAFSDPRFFYYLFHMDDEIRTKAKFILYHTWDNDPFPDFNTPWHNACDYIVMLSRFSYELMSSNGLECEYIPHGFDPSEFYKLPEEILTTEKTNFINHVAKARNVSNVDYIVFWNNRNLHRKRLLDVTKAFLDFYGSLEIESKKPLLLLHTQPVTQEGCDLNDFINKFNAKLAAPIVISNAPLSTDRLNVLYNISDVSVNISHSEGFGLGVGESLMTETPVIATRTGGMTEQMSDGVNTFGSLLDPAARVLFGIPGATYIYQDYADTPNVTRTLMDAYRRRDAWEMCGVLGREHLLKNYHINNTVAKWDIFLQKVMGESSKFKKLRMFVA